MKKFDSRIKRCKGKRTRITLNDHESSTLSADNVRSCPRTRGCSSIPSILTEQEVDQCQKLHQNLILKIKEKVDDTRARRYGGLRSPVALNRKLVIRWDNCLLKPIDAKHIDKDLRCSK